MLSASSCGLPGAEMGRRTPCLGAARSHPEKQILQRDTVGKGGSLQPGIERQSTVAFAAWDFRSGQCLHFQMRHEPKQI